MVSTWSLLAMGVSLVLSIVLPIIFLIILMKGRRGVFRIWTIGALGFAIPQLLIRIPVIQALGMFPAVVEFVENNTIVYLLILALTAGLFETLGRLIVFRVLKGKSSYMTGLVAGAGHGGIESIILVGTTYINNILISLLINSNQLSIITMGNTEMEEFILEELTGTSPGIFLVSGFERVFTMIFHIAMSIMLLYFIRSNRTLKGFFIVTGLHFALDFILPLMQLQGLSFILIEFFLFLVAIISLVFIIKIRPLFGEDQDELLKQEE